MSVLRACSSVGRLFYGSLVNISLDSYASAGFASTSRAVHKLPTSSCTTAAFHTSSTRLAESRKQQKIHDSRRINLEKREERLRKERENAPHVILGTRPGQASKWENCDLAKLVITAEQLEKLPVPSEEDNVTAPEYMNFGLDGLDGKQSKEELKKLLFTDLPQATSAASIDPHLADKMRIWKDIGEEPMLPDDKRIISTAEIREDEKAKQLARLVDLRNANARGIAFENRRRIIAAFSPSGKATDSGYPEVQG